MRNSRRWAAGTAAVLSLTMMISLSAAAEDKISIDMTDNNNEAWADIAMANDDTVTTGINIRSDADSDSETVGYLYRGGAVKVIYKGDTWTEIESGGVKGYIKNEYLTYGTDAKGLAEYYGTYGVEASWDDVKVFETNDKNSKIVSEADAGDTFTYIDTDGHFIQVADSNDNKVYVSEDDVTSVIMVNTALSVDSSDSSETASETNANSDSEAAADTVTQDTTAYTEAAAGETAAYTEAQDTAAYTEAPAAETAAYAETQDTTAYTEAPAEETAAYTETQDTTAYTEAPAETQAYYDTTSYTSFDGSVYATSAEAAQAAYQVYLNAQNEADRAVADGADADTINATASAAQQAYANYLTYQNAADAEAAGISASDGQTQTETYAETEAETYAETQAETYAETEAETYAPETDAYTETEAETSASVSTSDLDLLAAVIYLEAGNQPYEGMVAVGAVVMNRVKSSLFPNSISEVLYQSGQFSTASTFANALASGNVTSTCYAAAQDALAGSDPTGGCLYFNNFRGSGVHIGDQWFY